MPLRLAFSGDKPDRANLCRFWPHAPQHRLSAGGTFIVTSGTYRKIHRFTDEKRLKGLHDGLLPYAKLYAWQLEAWAVFSNHYHFEAHSPVEANDGAESLVPFLAEFHQKSASWVNGLDGMKGRTVWHNYRETRLTSRNSYLVRLKYVNKKCGKTSIGKSCGGLSVVQCGLV